MYPSPAVRDKGGLHSRKSTIQPPQCEFKGAPVILIFLSNIINIYDGDPLKMAIQALKPLFSLSNFLTLVILLMLKN